MSITKEQIARVFAMYPTTPCLLPRPGRISKGHIVDFTCRGVPEIYFYDGEGRPKFDYTGSKKSAKLLLTPLSAISDEDAAVLSTVFFPDGNVHDYLWGAPTGRAIVASIKSGRQTNTFYPHARVHDGIMFLIQKGYAVPLFIEADHQDNGKTAIELGIAIDKTKLESNG